MSCISEMYNRIRNRCSNIDSGYTSGLPEPNFSSGEISEALFARIDRVVTDPSTPIYYNEANTMSPEVYDIPLDAYNTPNMTAYEVANRRIGREYRRSPMRDTAYEVANRRIGREYRRSPMGDVLFSYDPYPWNDPAPVKRDLAQEELDMIIL